MKKLATVGLIILALIVGVGAAYFSNQSNTTTNTQESEEPAGEEAAAPALGDVDGDTRSLDEEIASNAEQTVTFSDEGFQPEELRVAAGTTVTFENASSRDIWVASDPHPSHTDLPEFDAQRGYAPGESYSYTFDEVGEWGYHDHLRSFDTGIVIVE